MFGGLGSCLVGVRIVFGADAATTAVASVPNAEEAPTLSNTSGSLGACDVEVPSPQRALCTRPGASRLSAPCKPWELVLMLRKDNMHVVYGVLPGCCTWQEDNRE